MKSDGEGRAGSTAQREYSTKKSPAAAVGATASSMLDVCAARFLAVTAAAKLM